MPKQSKVGRPPKSSPGKASAVKERPEKYYCTRCTRYFTKQKGNFPASQSPMFRENNGYLPVCRHCVEEMYDHYKEVFEDEQAAIRRICMKFDIYWNPRVYAMLSKTSTTNSRILSYISKSNLYQFVGKTFDDTLDEECGFAVTTPMEQGSEVIEAEQSDARDEIVISRDIEEFWGVGFAASYYADFERRLKYWIGDVDRYSMDVSECAIIRQICMLETTIARDTAAGKQTEKSISALNNLLGSANLKPVQKKKDESIDAAVEATPFGVWIRKIENTRPIDEPEEQFKDVDGIAKYVSVWFLGHLCKMMKIENQYSRLYEEEMEKLRVERPEYEGEDEETVFEDIFERVSKAEGGDADAE